MKTRDHSCLIPCFPAQLLLLLILTLTPLCAAFAQSMGYHIGSTNFVSIRETQGVLILSVQRCCEPELPAGTVQIRTQDGTAKSVSDYLAINTTLVFDKGQTSADVRITIVDDSITESEESFYVTLYNPKGGTGIAAQNGSTTVFISDDDRGFAIQQSPGLAVSETQGSFTLTVFRDGASLPAGSVELFTTDGTAKAGSDYIALTTNLVFDAGEKSKPVTISLLNDGAVEGTESFTVALRNVTGGTPLDLRNRTNIEIHDDERGFYFPYGGGVYVQEGVTMRAYISVARYGSALPTASVELVTVDGTAAAGLDYAVIRTNLSFAAGEDYKYLEIPILNDGLVEADESFTLRIQNAVGWSLSEVPGETELKVTIQDNDLGFVVRWADPDSQGYIAENQGAARFAVEIVGDFELKTESSVQVDTQTPNFHPAAEGEDYLRVRQRLTFKPGERVKYFTVPILNDGIAESDEFFQLVLSDPIGLPVSYLASQSTMLVAIYDNEQGYRLGEETLKTSFPGFVFREGETASVTIWRDGDFDITSRARLIFSSTSEYYNEEGTAVAGVDFPPTNIETTFGPGEHKKVITFDLPDDGVAGSEKSFFLTLESDDPKVPVQEQYARGYILDSGLVPALVDPDFDLAFPLQSSIDAYNSNSQKLLVTPDGKTIYVADRSGFDGHRGGVILKVLSDGAADPTWTPVKTPSQVTAIALAPGGKLVVAQEPYDQFGDPVSPLFRLDKDGVQDLDFDLYPDDFGIRFLLVSADGKVLVYSDYNGMQRYTADGKRDLGFHPLTPDDYPRAMKLDAQHNILVNETYKISRYKPDGSPDSTFNSPEDPVNGPFSDFDAFLPLNNGGLITIATAPEDGKRKLIRAKPDGTFDPSFSPRTVGYYTRLTTAEDGSIWLLRVSANLELLGGYLEKLEPDGYPDPDWAPQQVLSHLFVRALGDSMQAAMRGYVNIAPGMAALPDGGVLLLGAQLINGQPRHSLTMIHPAATFRVVVDPETARIPENSGIATISFLRSGPIMDELTLDWSTEPITAVPGKDYVSSKGVIQFAAGRRNAIITVTVIDNSLPDRDRTVRIRFTSPIGGPIPPPTGFAIANEDPGFPPDGIRLLSDGQLLLRPTGWLEKRDAGNRLGLESGLLEDLQSNASYQRLNLMDPYPEFIANPENINDGQSMFFRIRSYP